MEWYDLSVAAFMPLNAERRDQLPPVEVYGEIQSEVAECAQRGKPRNNCGKSAEVVGCLTAIDASVGYACE